MWVRKGLVEKVTFKLIDECQEGTQKAMGKRAFQSNEDSRLYSAEVGVSTYEEKRGVQAVGRE
jgi:hypothetical protein